MHHRPLVPSARVPTVAFLQGPGRLWMLKNAQRPIGVDGRRPTRLQMGQGTWGPQRPVGVGPSHRDAAPGPPASPLRRGRTNRAWCARWRDPTTVAAFRGPDGPGSPRRWFPWSSVEAPVAPPLAAHRGGRSTQRRVAPDAREARAQAPRRWGVRVGQAATIRLSRGSRPAPGVGRCPSVRARAARASGPPCAPASRAG